MAKLLPETDGPKIHYRSESIVLFIFLSIKNLMTFIPISIEISEVDRNAMHVYFHLQNCEQIEITGPDKTPPEDSYESAFTLVFSTFQTLGAVCY